MMQSSLVTVMRAISRRRPGLNELMDCSITETELRLLDAVKYEVTLNSTESAQLICTIPRHADMVGIMIPVTNVQSSTRCPYF